MSPPAFRARAVFWALLCIGTAAAEPPPATPPLTAVVTQPRPTGYFVGDLVTQRVLLEGRGRPYTLVTLPPPGRVNSWFERRRATLVTDASSQHWLAVEYQFLNAPKAVTAATLPAWQLTVRTTAAPAPLTLTIPATSLNIAPLSPPGSPEQVGTRDLRPDHLPAKIAKAPICRAIAITSTGLALTLTAWLGWVLWRNKRAQATQPFAHALRELRTLPDDEPRAWQILHRAFDQAAGRVIHSATLSVLFERAPQLTPMRAQIEEFFVQSTERFFAHGNSARTDTDARNTSASGSGAGPQARPDADLHNTSPPSGGAGPQAHAAAPAIHDRARSAPAPLALCQVLRVIEKRHEP